MNIILGDQNVKEASDKYVVLELDRFCVEGQEEPVSAFCLIENVPIQELAQVNHYRDLHQQLIKNYRLANWKFCEDALEHLQGRWNGEVDSFYKLIGERINFRKLQPDPADWDPVISI